jgi:hypothetical protein
MAQVAQEIKILLLGPGESGAFSSFHGVFWFFSEQDSDRPEGKILFSLFIRLAFDFPPRTHAALRQAKALCSSR